MLALRVAGREASAAKVIHQTQILFQGVHKVNDRGAYSYYIALGQGKIEGFVDELSCVVATNGIPWHA